MIRIFRNLSSHLCQSRSHLALWILLLWFGHASAGTGETILVDFESERLSETWVAVRKIRALRVACPESTRPKANAPAGRAVRIQTSGSAGLFTRTGKIRQDWPKVETLSFWVYRTPAEVEQHKSTTLEVQFYEPDGKTRYWQKVVLDHAGWKPIRVNLKWCRWGPGRIPDWGNINRFGFWFRDGGEIVIDNVSVHTGPNQSAWLTDSDLKSIIAPNAPASVKIFQEGPHARLLTNASQLDARVLARHLDTVGDKIIKEFNFLPSPSRPAYLIVFADREQYRSFPSRFAKHQNAEVSPLNSDGFTFQGIATSYWTEIYGTFRPAYTHEFAHSLLSQLLDLPNRGEWLHEGLAVRYQLDADPQKNFSEIVAQGVANSKARLPLDKLCNGKPTRTQFYWQAATVVDFLSSKHAKKWPTLIKAMRKKGSTNLAPHLATVLETDWDHLESEWVFYCREKYPKKTE